ncbi:MAG: hypothetical protein KQ78_00461 [Candidatus Izimaplasma bacterium HR2]|nr:MAG: hypothetical protein KQ78_00461 [Candidatus Izimaplasma bacterium HR2]
MRLQQYLLTEGRMKTIDRDEMEKLLNGKYSDAFDRFLDNDDSYIFRGDQTEIYDFAIGHGKGTRKRKSRNTTNYSTLFFDNHPSWSKFPKRSESFICSTSIKTAKSYGFSGGVYHIFPENGTTIGVCSGIDMFLSFRETIPLETVADVNNFIIATMVYAEEIFNISVNRSDDSYRIMKGSNDKITKAFYNASSDEKSHFISKLDGNYLVIMGDDFDGDIIKRLNEIYNPKTNGFNIVKSGQKIPDKREVWMSGNCLFVSLESMKEMI